MIRYLKTYVRAQLIILLLIGTLCVAVLSAVGMESSIFYGVLTGFMDMLPFIGTGIMLVPLAVIRILHEEYVSAGDHFTAVCGLCTAQGIPGTQADR